MQVEQDGTTKLLTNEVNGKQINYANDLDFDKENQIIYFSDSSEIAPIYDSTTGLWSTMKAALLDLFCGYPSGRLLKYDLKTQRGEELMTDIAYANGVALSKDKSFVLVAETGRFKILRYWLTGPKGGSLFRNK
jgi:sugar lactone lactonase YvrE